MLHTRHFAWQGPQTDLKAYIMNKSLVGPMEGLLPKA